MDLFDRHKPAAPAEPDEPPPPPGAPLADRMRPRTFDELVGHDEALGPQTSLGRAIRAAIARAEHERSG